MDSTKHNLEQHTTEPKPHTDKWYAFWGNKCPVCGAEAETTLV